MIDKRNKTKYYLFYGTNHIKGLEKMKDAMWKIVPTGEYSFSDRDYQQVTLFETYFDPDHLGSLILSRFKGKIVDISEIAEYVIRRTPYRIAHIRQAITPLERTNVFEVVTKRKRRYTYPPGTMIKFM